MSLPPPSPWIPEGDKVRLAVLGKFAEELAECFEATALFSMYGDAGAVVEDAQKTYGIALIDEIADVLSGVQLVVDEFYNSEFPQTAEINSAKLEDFQVALARCSAATSRCIIQGFSESHPVTSRPNRDWLWSCLVDVVYLARGCSRRLGASQHYVANRIGEKVAHKRDWHDLIRQRLKEDAEDVLAARGALSDQTISLDELKRELGTHTGVEPTDAMLVQPHVCSDDARKRKRLRPSNFLELSLREQRAIDKRLGIRARDREPVPVGQLFADDASHYLWAEDFCRVADKIQFDPNNPDHEEWVATWMANATVHGDDRCARRIRSGSLAYRIEQRVKNKWEDTKHRIRCLFRPRPPKISCGE